MTRYELAQLAATLGALVKHLRSGEYTPRYLADTLEQEKEKVLRAIQSSLDEEERTRSLRMAR
jgi:hypothetical protein